MIQNIQTNLPIPEVDGYVEVIFEKFKPDFAHCAQDYEWTSGQQTYDCYKTIQKFNTFVEDWRDDQLKNRLEVASQILDWGSIRVSATTPVGQLICGLISSRVSTADQTVMSATNPFKTLVETYIAGRTPRDWRIASWSKVLTVINPREFFICDSRVCYALNQLCSEKLLDGELDYAFPCLPARISSRDDEHNKLKQTFEENVQDFTDASDFYFNFYCKLIKELASQFANPDLFDLTDLKKYLIKSGYSEDDQTFRYETLPHLIEMALFMYGKKNHLNEN